LVISAVYLLPPGLPYLLYAAVPGAGTAGGYAGKNLCMSYDDFGNRGTYGWQTAACSAPAPGTAAAGVTSSNRLSSYTYDAAGNVVNDGNNQYAYDNEGRLCAVQTTPISGGTVTWVYLYDAEGGRVAKGTVNVGSAALSAAMCNPATYPITVTESYVLGPSGEELTTYTWSGGQSTWARSNVYAGGLLATYDTQGSGLHYQLTDQLGTRRVQTDPAGTPETDCRQLPYGDGLNCFAAPGAASTGAAGDDANPLHFTGKQRDTETGNDYFLARYYSSNMGRFMSPDWSAKIEPVPYSKLDDPQTLNLYAYVRNNPVGNADPDGHRQPQLTDRFGCSEDEYCDGNEAKPYDSLTAAEKATQLENYVYGSGPGLSPAVAAQVQTAQQKNSQQTQTTSSSTTTSNDRIANALGALPGVASVTPTGDPSFAQGGHKNETESLSFSSPKDEATLLATSSRKGLLPSGVSENGFGPGVRLSGGLHVENGRLDPVTGNLMVTSHIDRFNANNGLAPLIGHFVVDVFIGTVFFHHTAGLDQ